MDCKRVSLLCTRWIGYCQRSFLAGQGWRPPSRWQTQTSGEQKFENKQSIFFFSSLSFYLYTYLYINIIPQLLFLTFQHSLILNSKSQSLKKKSNFQITPIQSIVYIFIKEVYTYRLSFYFIFFSWTCWMCVCVSFYSTFIILFLIGLSVLFFILLRISGWAGLFFFLSSNLPFLADCLLIYKGHIFVSSNVNTSIRIRIMGGIYLNKIDREMIELPTKKPNCFPFFL